MSDSQTPLEDLPVAMLAADGFEQIELTSPKRALESAGLEVRIVSLEDGTIQGHHHRDHGDDFDVDDLVQDASANAYGALVIPGGLFSPDTLRVNQDVQAFVRGFFEQSKIVAAICHGPQVLISANVVDGRTMTAVEPVRHDLKNAGANVVDQAVVCDQGLITSRTPDDLDAFNAKLIEEIEEGRHRAQQQSV